MEDGPVSVARRQLTRHVEDALSSSHLDWSGAARG